MKKAYYARPMAIYGSKQEMRDIETMSALGFESIDINKKEIQAAYDQQGMAVFLEYVKKADAIFFRRQLDGKIGAGVYKEIQWAIEADLPVVELPGAMVGTVATVNETREYLNLSGFR